MGFEITLVAEVRRFPHLGDHAWLPQVENPFIARDYDLFCLAGWDGRRHYPDGEHLPAPIVTPRGLPEDCHLATRLRYGQEGGHDATWLTATEWAAIVRRRVGAEPAAAWDGIILNGLLDAQALGALLDRYEAAGWPTRLVLWFT